MKRKLILAAAAFAAVCTLSGPVYAGPSDYVFEPVQAEVKKGDGVTVAVRLVHKPSGKPVTDAVVASTRIDMGPDGMGSMAAPLTPLPSPGPGIYAFKTDLTMAGRWQFSIGAKVQGEPQTVVGKVIFSATQ